MQSNDLLFDYQPQRKPKTERYLTFKWDIDWTTNEQIEKLKNIFKENNISYVLYRSQSYYPHEWVVSKGRFSWNNIMEMVNSIHSSKYDFISSDNEKMIYDNINHKYIMSMQAN